MLKTSFISLTLVLSVIGIQSFAAVGAGRLVDEEQSFYFGMNYGSIDSIDGTITETKRAGASAVTTEGRFLETYDFGEFGYDGSFAAFGFNLEKQWKYFTFMFDLNYFKADASARARRVYALGVDEVRFQGKDYEYMLIDAGDRFTSEISAAIMDLKFAWTPFHIEGPNGLTFTPMVLGGLYIVGGTFEIDAGKANGLTTYEIDPFPYVQGGKGEGSLGAVAPEIGLGAEVKFPVFYFNGGTAWLALQGTFSFLDIVANSGDFGVSARNEKNVDLEFTNFELRARLELPISEETDFFVGFGIKSVAAQAEIEAQRQAPGQKTTEKYDKDAELEIDSTYFMAGFNF